MNRSTKLSAFRMTLASLLALGCAGAAAVAATVRADAGRARVVEASSVTAASAAIGADPIRLVTAPTGNVARYRVREQLARLEFPNDAVGVTHAITGTIVLNDGRVVRAASRFEIDLTTLESDNARRDNFIRRNTLATDRYPTAVFVPTDVHGLASAVPADGDFALQLVGELTIHGVTRPTTWDVHARARNGVYTGTAVTEFAFGDFGMSIPRVAVVLSVRDLIRLEYDFRLVRADASR